MLNPNWTALIAFVCAFAACLWIHPYILTLAKIKHITDDPDERKLQHEPVPVLGGIAVLFGILTGTLIAHCFFDCRELLVAILAGGMMLYLGSIDDSLSLSPGIRFAFEIVLTLLLISCGMIIDDFHGLFGIHRISRWIAVPLTVVAVVGIINAINLIDGVDGLSSGLCITVCIIYCIIFAKVGDWPWAVLALVCAGALFPFFLHNIFGRTTHIYIGDGGTLLMGLMLSCFVIEVLRSGSPASQLADQNTGLCLVAMVLATLSEPVFDCLRVMGWRMAKGLSPFMPDKTHLHHLFIEARFSHVFTSLFIILFNLLVFGVWYLSYKLGLRQGVQGLIVICMAALVTFGFYAFMAGHRKRNTRFYRHFVWFGLHTHLKRTGFWIWMRNLMDRL